MLPWRVPTGLSWTEEPQGLPTLMVSAGQDAVAAVASMNKRYPTGAMRVLLERGGTFKGPLPVRAGSWLGSFGDEAGERPLVMGPVIAGQLRGPPTAIVGVHGQGTGRGQRFVWGVQCGGLLIEDCEIEQYKDGVAYEATGRGGCHDLIVRRSVIHNNFPRGGEAGDGHSQGLYVQYCSGDLRLEENVFFENGTPPAVIFNHNVYAGGGNDPMVSTGNTYWGGGATGLQCRCGGLVEWDLYVDNPTHLTYGWVLGNGPKVWGGVRGGVIQNVLMIGGAGIPNPPSAGPRGYGLQVANVVDLTVEKLVIANDSQGGNGWAVSIESGHPGDFEYEKMVGVGTLSMKDVAIRNWKQTLGLGGGVRAGNGLDPKTVRSASITGIVKDQNAVVAGPWNIVPPTATWADNQPEIVSPGLDWIQRALKQRRGRWDTALTARSVIENVWATLGWTEAKWKETLTGAKIS